MLNKNNNLYLYSFYRFKKIKNIKTVKRSLEMLSPNYKLRGTILIANEGINASISGRKPDLELVMKNVRKIFKIRKYNLKINKIKFLPFNKYKIRLKNEIVSLGKGNIKVNRNNKKSFIEPKKWEELISQKDLILIDLRNDYEIEIGKFKKATNLLTKNFREFPKKFSEMRLNKSDKIAMYCTGGIRCEKASNYLSTKGYKNIFQLDGGIINYFEYKKNLKKDAHWKGECFVFDNRVSITSQLSKGKYEQCYGCRHPISSKDMKSKNYLKGVFCPKCHSNRTEQQKANSLTRQNQIIEAEYNNLEHPFKKVQ